RTPRSTLFPSTTLFRSKHGVPEGRVGEWEGLSGLRVHPPCRSAPPRRRRLRPRAATGGVSHPEDGLSIRNGQWSQPASAAGAPTDRKSTRLNSSHVKIS